jgi:hypothetical protein
VYQRHRGVLSNVSVTIRHANDPFLVAYRIYGYPISFGPTQVRPWCPCQAHPSYQLDNFVTGVALLAVGAVLLLPPAARFGMRVVKRRRRRERETYYNVEEGSTRSAAELK